MEISIEVIKKTFKQWHADVSGGVPCKSEAIEWEAYKDGALWMQKTLQIAIEGTKSRILELQEYIAKLRKTADDRYETIVALRTSENEVIGSLRAENKKLTETAQAQFNTIQNLKIRAAGIPPPVSIEVAGLQWELNRERDMYRQFTIEKDGEINRLAHEVSKLARENQSLKGLLDDRANTINSMSDAIVKKELEIAKLKELLAKGSLLGCSHCQDEMLDAQADAKNARIELEDLKSKIIENAIELAGFTRLV